MKKYILTLFCAMTLVGVTEVFAQPTVVLNPDFTLINAGEIATIDFDVRDFTDIQAMTFSVRWDPEVVFIDNPIIDIFNGNPLLTNLDLFTDVTFDNDEGWLVFEWQVMDPLDCNSTLDVTINDFDEDVLPPGDPLFSVNFTGITSYTHLTLGDDPVEQYVTRTNSCPVDITMFTDDAFIAVNNLPITLDVPFANANEGETVCLDFTVDDFIDIISFQFTIGWDPTILEFASITGLNLPNFTGINPIPPDGIATVSWFNTPDGITLPDGTAIIQICFNVIGGCGETALVSIIDEPTQIEITNQSDPGTDIGFLAGEGQVSINCFNPDGLTAIVESASVSPGEDFCLDLTVENFDDLVGFTFNVNWNPQLLDFTGFQNINNDLFFFNAGNWDQSMANQGILTVSWNDPSCFGDDLTDGDILSTLCFTAIGGCVNSPVSITGNPSDIEVLDACFGDDIGINTFNGLVEIVCPDGIVVSAGAYTQDPGDFICIPVEVSNFDKIEDLTFTIEWETGVLQYVSVGNFGLPNLGAPNFDDSFAAFGAMCINWEDISGAGITLVDGTAIFDLCFNVIGDPYACSPINFTDFPCGINVVTTESSGVNVGLTPQIGEVCINNPFNFSVNISQNNGIVGEEVCVDVTVENFVSLEELDFSINWNPSQLEFTQLINPLNLPNFSVASFDDSNGGVGSLTVDWNSQSVNGNSVPNGTVIFTLCYELIGDEGNCEDITITNSPQAINVVPANSGGINIGLIQGDGEICIIESLSVAASITGVDCPGDNTGSIDLTVTGGSGNYSFEWGAGITPPNANDEDQFGLTNQTYTVIVTDTDNPLIFVEQMFEVPLSGFAPVADAGDDLSLPCGTSLFNLDGTGSSQGVGQYTYLWTGLGSGSVQPGTETLINPTIFGPGEYELMVTDETTDCVVFDTVNVTAAIIPGVQIEATDSIDCTIDTVMITSVGSSNGPDFEYLWTTATGFIVPGTETTGTAEVTGEGWYFLTVTDLNNDCSSFDSAFIQVDTIMPIADAGLDQVIDCNSNTATLDGSLSTSGVDITYMWTDPMGGMAGNTDIITASDIGVYDLLVTNISNGCMDVDSVEIVGDLDLPTADAGQDQFITCLVDTVTLDGTGSSTGGPGEYTYSWVALSGNLVGPIDMLTAQADQPGEYQLTVTNTVNGCDAITTVFVIEDIQNPIAEAGLTDTITCDIPTIMLNGAGSSVGTLGEFTYLWTGPPTITNETILTPEVNAGGTFYIEVTDTFNGCTAIDSVVIVNEQDNVVAMIEMPDTITCLVACINLDATASSSGPNITYSWSGNPCINTADPLNPQVCCAGVFSLTVTDTSTGCSAVAVVTVIENTESPIYEPPIEDYTYTCSDDCFTIDATGSSTGPEFEYAWTTIPAGNGTIDSGEDTLEPVICAPGVYGIVITNTSNGCFTTGTVNVAADTIPPAAIIFSDVQITCDDPTVTLDGSTSGPDVTDFQWYFEGTPVAGATMDMLDASDPGQYILEVFGANGCSSSDTTDLMEALPPVADADEETEIGCMDEFVTIQNTGSTTGTDIVYSWTALSGELDAATIGQQNPNANSIGTYVLEVTDNLTGCSATDTVFVVSGAGSLPEASFTYDQEECTDEAMLFGTDEDGITGVWSVTTIANIETTTEPITVITNLQPGINIVTWTLSAADCPDYSSFSDTIFVESFPIANNDTAEMGETETQIDIAVLDNDFLNGNAGLVQISIPPVIGSAVAAADGIVAFSAPITFGGEAEFTYSICSDVCPQLCDSALVLINIDREAVLNVPSGITPNGDGLNDVLVFDLLLLNPEKFPNNKITIFNRWGDIVYEALPYQNDWGGTNQNGDLLPQGTYYFVFRLDVGESEIIRGDITIVR